MGNKSDNNIVLPQGRLAGEGRNNNMIDENRVCKDKIVYAKHSGVCLETQVFPNSLKYTYFPNGILSKNEKYDSVTVYKFI